MYNLIMIQTKQCPKCNQKMEPGIIGDQFKNFRLFDKAFWGSSLGFLGGLKDKKEIVSFRCENCGYLENYTK